MRLGKVAEAYVISLAEFKSHVEHPRRIPREQFELRFANRFLNTSPGCFSANHSLIDRQLEFGALGPDTNRLALEVRGEHGTKALFVTSAEKPASERGVVHGVKIRELTVYRHGPFPEILEACGALERRLYGLFPSISVIAHPKRYFGFSKRVARGIKIGTYEMALCATAPAKGLKSLVTQNPIRHCGRKGQLELRFLVHDVKTQPPGLSETRLFSLLN